MSQTLDAVLCKGQTMPEKNRFPAVLQPSLYESHPNDSRVTGPVEQCPTVSARWGTGGNNTPLVTDGATAYSIAPGRQGTPEKVDDIHVTEQDTSRTLDGTCADPERRQGGTLIVQPSFAYDDRNQAVSTDTHHTLRGESAVSRTSDAVVQSGEASAFSWQCRGDMRGMVPRPTAQLQRCQIEAVMVQPAMHVRRLTPVECERLQGFPDGWTDIKPNGKDTPDSPRYKALGNSMAVPVMRWIGMRIAEASGG